MESGTQPVARDFQEGGIFWASRSEQRSTERGLTGLLEHVNLLVFGDFLFFLALGVRTCLPGAVLVHRRLGLICARLLVRSIAPRLRLLEAATHC